MKLTLLDHVGIRAVDPKRAEEFYVGVLGLQAHPDKTNWLTAPDGRFSVHLMPASMSGSPGQGQTDFARHIALGTDDLVGVVDGLLAAGYHPVQATITGEQLELTDSRDLSFGIGTVFVTDPDDNVLEFVDRRQGIFADVLGSPDHG